MPDVGVLPVLKRIVVGHPIPSQLAHHERLSRVTGLAVLSSDPLSSVAYATEEILRVLAAAGGAALTFANPIAVVIAAILAIVVFSYRQTIQAYPSGGGAYVVAKENIGSTAALVAGAALLIDYVLTVSVSIAAGVAAITSAIPAWRVDRVAVAVAFVMLLTVGNLRGVRESGRLFALPTYVFIVSILSLIAVGAWHVLTDTAAPLARPEDPLHSSGDQLGLFLLLTAFSNGCTAMTGVEAVSNGVPAFKPPEPKNAVATLVTMACLSIAMFLGITFLAETYQAVPSASETIVSQLARGVFNGRGVPYYAVQIGTMLILVLAANTAYADFPRLSSIIARDRYLPRQFMNQGDRLAFSNGIVVLSLLAIVLLVLFDGDTHALIPLYMIGVFVSFTLSQAGMVFHWCGRRIPGWRTSALINGIGATVTGIVLLVVTITKAHEGAWIILLLIPVLVGLFRITHRHYQAVAQQLALSGAVPSDTPVHNTVLVPIGGMQRAVVRALDYAKTLSPDVRAVYVDVDPVATEQLGREWDAWGRGLPLVTLPSPYRSLLEPLLGYIEHLQRGRPNDFVTVVIPEFVPSRWWQHVFHNQRALLIKGALLFKPNTVVTSVPFHLAK